ncbi:MAG: ABC transporter permease [Prevotella sp.]|nr:ABC transporter permease [Prevotella sp.]
MSSFIRKEMLHILRDRRTLLVVLVVPLMLIMLFGFTVSTDVNNINVMVCAPHRSYAVAQAVNRMTASRYFEFKGFVDAGDIDQSPRTGKAAAVVVFADDYDVSGKYQLLLDGADVNTARTSQAYLQSVLSMGNVAVKQSGIQTHMLFNPQMKSSFNFVPGIMGMIFLLICAMMTSISIVKEKETGTMEVLLVSPVKPIYIIVSKMIPYLLLSFIDLVIILVLAYFVLDVPLAGGVGNVVLVSVLYLVLALALGMMVSNVVESQVAALLISAMVMIMPVIFFSGLLFPTENIPWALRWISYVVPPRWYIDAMRKLMIEGVDLKGVLLEVGVLLAETVVLMTAAVKKFNDRLE